MDTKKELWDRLENEPERAYRAFECFLSLPSGERTLLEAYRRHVGNSEAVKPSDTWTRWANTFAWRERAAAYDDHLASVRREAYETAVEEEAARQAREVEKTRGRMNELLTVACDRAMECLEDEDWVSRNLRASDVIQIMRLHMDAVKAFDADRESGAEAEWTEEDEAEIADIIKEIDELEDAEEDSNEESESDEPETGSDEGE
jgi:hypothetical protein